MTALRTLAILVLICASTARAADVGGSDAPLANPLAAQTLEGLSATRERPLFSPSRRPPPPPPVVRAEPPPPAPPPPPPNVVLLGVVMDAEETRAVVRATDKILRVQIGDDVGGWKVSQIDGRKLVLSLDDRFATFTMFAGESGGSEEPTTGADSTGDDTRAEPRPQQSQPQSHQSQPTPSPSRRLRRR